MRTVKDPAHAGFFVAPRSVCAPVQARIANYDPTVRNSQKNKTLWVFDGKATRLGRAEKPTRVQAVNANGPNGTWIHDQT